MANILIVGAGFVGAKLAQTLAKKGHQVSAIRRSNQSLGSKVKVIQTDVTQPLNPDSLPEQVDIFIYCISAPEFNQQAYHAHYPLGLKHCLEALKTHSVRHAFFISSTGVYAQNDGSWVDETSVTEPTTFSGLEMLEAENILLASGFNASVVRFSGIYGPERNRLIQQAQTGGYCDPEPPLWTNRIHRDDCVNAMVFLLQHALDNQPLDKIYLLTDDLPAPLHEVIEWMQQELDEIADEDKNLSQSRKSNKRLSNQRLRALGYKFKYPSYKQGYRSQINAINQENNRN